MPSLLDQDFMLGRDGLPMPRIEPPSDGLLATGTPTWADAWQFNKQAAGNWIDEQRAISEERGLWNPETGLPTAHTSFGGKPLPSLGSMNMLKDPPEEIAP